MLPRVAVAWAAVIGKVRIPVSQQELIEDPQWMLDHMDTISNYVFATFSERIMAVLVQEKGFTFHGRGPKIDTDSAW